MNESQVKARVEDLLARSSPQSADWDSLAPQLVQGTITVLESL